MPARPGGTTSGIEYAASPVLETENALNDEFEPGSKASLFLRPEVDLFDLEEEGVCGHDSAADAEGTEAGAVAAPTCTSASPVGPSAASAPAVAAPGACCRRPSLYRRRPSLYRGRPSLYRPVRSLYCRRPSLYCRRPSLHQQQR